MWVGRIFKWAGLVTLTVAQLVARADDQTTCAQVLRNVHSERRVSLLIPCMDFYFVNKDLDPQPNSFNAVIQLGYRVIELDPNHVEAYGIVAWLLWSKWVAWHENPLRMPDGANRVNEAMALLDLGEGRNADSADYYLEAAQTMRPFAKIYLPDMIRRVLDWYYKADRNLPRSDERKVRTRLQIAHLLRFANRSEDALRAYQRVLDLDANNYMAKLYIRCMNGLAACPGQRPAAAAP